MFETIIESTNFFIMIVCAYALYSFTHWKWKGKIDAKNNDVIVAWAWIFSAVGCSAAWFAMSRHTAPAGGAFNPVMYEWRWAMKLAVSSGFAWGMLMFVGLVEGHTPVKKFGFFIIFFAVAFALGVY